MVEKHWRLGFVKIRNPFLISLIILGATVVLFMVGAINNAVLGVYWIMAFDLLLVVLDSCLWGYTFCHFLMFSRIEKNIKNIEEMEKEREMKAENLEPFDTFDGDE